MTVTLQDYERADRFLPWNLAEHVYHPDPKLHWTGESAFWYVSQSSQGKEYFRVILEEGIHAPAFDHDRLAAVLSAHLKKEINRQDLELAHLVWVDSGLLKFTFAEKRWQCNLENYECLPDGPAEKPLPTRERLAPNDRHSIFAEAHNLYLHRLETGEVSQLTSDGQAYYDYGGYSETNLLTVTLRPYKDLFPPNAIWSPDSQKVLTQRLDQRKMKWLNLLQSCPPEDQRPRLHSFHFPFPGDENLSRVEMVILDIQHNTIVFSDLGALEHNVMDPIGTHNAWWSQDSSKIYLIHFDRYFKKVQFFEIDAFNGKSRRLLEETSETYIDMTPVNYGIPNVRMVRQGKEFLWYSERSGWGNLYRYSAETGELLNPVACGDFVVQKLLHVDEQNEWIYFSACGREPGRDPYYPHLYRAALNGSRMELLTPEDACHEIEFSPDASYFVDTYSRVDLPPVSVVRQADGRLVKLFKETDIRILEEMGWKPPEVFKVKANDGKTDLYGLIYRPSNFVEERSYPVIDSIYPGPQRIRTPKKFEFDPAQALAELGFIVITVDGRGTPYRSKAFHDHCYANFNDPGGLEDHIAAIRQLAERHPYLDMQRVGIYGHSAGGFASTKAILRFPDFFKAAVSSAGCHDLRANVARWAEKYSGPISADELGAQGNIPIASSLQGKLMLVTGDMDDNVPPALTFQLADALIKANKSFDLLVVPNANHKVNSHPYFIRRKWDFFVRHLLGVEPPGDYALSSQNVPHLDIRSYLSSE